jgi:hypothetical protein
MPPLPPSLYNQLSVCFTFAPPPLPPGKNVLVSNSRCETLAAHEQRLQQRCIVLFEGFYEWRQQQQQHGSGGGGDKIAHAIRLSAGFNSFQPRDDAAAAAPAGSSHEVLMIGARAHQPTRMLVRAKCAGGSFRAIGATHAAPPGAVIINGCCSIVTTPACMQLQVLYNPMSPGRAPPPPPPPSPPSSHTLPQSLHHRMPLLLLTAQVPPPPLLLLLLLLKFTLQDAAVWLDPHASLKSVENVFQQQQQQEVKEEAAGEAGGMFSIIEVAPFVNRCVKRSYCCCCCCCR